MYADRVSHGERGTGRARREWLSALFDGECGHAAADPTGWEAADDATWDAYHCIGEAMRASAAAQLQAADPAFVRAVMARIAQEPMTGTSVTSASPTAATTEGVSPRPAANDAVFRWKMVAGVATLAAVLTLAWQAGGVIGTPVGGAPSVASASAPVAVAVPSAAAVPAARQAVWAGSERDPQLEEFLAAHRQWGGASALQSSAGFLRTASVEAPVR